jgi:hypothetical protein
VARPTATLLVGSATTVPQILKELKNNFTGKIGIGHCDFQLLPVFFEHLDWHEH